MENVNIYSQNNYQYKIYQEYLDRTKANIVSYSKNPDLVIKYYNINITESQNINKIDFNQYITTGPEDLGRSNPEDYNIILKEGEINTQGTGLLEDYKNCIWDIYEFQPVVDFQPLQYAESRTFSEGTQGSFGTIFLDYIPNPGDLFTFYNVEIKPNLEVPINMKFFKLQE